MTYARHLQLLGLLLLIAMPSQAAIYKCEINGRIQFSDRPCARSAENITKKVGVTDTRHTSKPTTPPPPAAPVTPIAPPAKPKKNPNTSQTPEVTPIQQPSPSNTTTPPSTTDAASAQARETPPPAELRETSPVTATTEPATTPPPEPPANAAEDLVKSPEASVPASADKSLGGSAPPGTIRTLTASACATKMPAPKLATKDQAASQWGQTECQFGSASSTGQWQCRPSKKQSKFCTRPKQNWSCFRQYQCNNVEGNIVLRAPGTEFSAMETSCAKNISPLQKKAWDEWAVGKYAGRCQSSQVELTAHWQCNVTKQSGSCATPEKLWRCSARYQCQ